MKTVYILKGLPGSGKSTWAREQIENHPGSYKRVNKDDLRKMLDNSHWSKKNEQLVLLIRDRIILMALRDGKHVIVDDTNLNPEHEEHINTLVAKENVRVVVKFFDVDVNTCIERDLKRTSCVGQNVILDMYNKWLKVKPEMREWDPDLKDAVICDIDGTLALMKDRGPFDWDKVDRDELNRPIKHLLTALQCDGTGIGRRKVIIVSGRDSVCREKTLKWLEQKSIRFDELHMRPEGDMRKDAVIKKEIYDELKKKYNILFVLDDRNQTVEMWRQQGLTCLQVADGNF
jgi:predicted kinase